MDEDIEKDLEFLEDENQCLHDELEVVTKELEAITTGREEMENLLAYFIWDKDPHNRGYIQQMTRAYTNRIPEPFEIAKIMGYHARPGDGQPTRTYAVPRQAPMSFRGGGGFPAIPQSTHYNIEIPNLRLERQR